MYLLSNIHTRNFKIIICLLYNIKLYTVSKSVSIYCTIFKYVWFQNQHVFIIQYFNIYHCKINIGLLFNFEIYMILKTVCVLLSNIRIYTISKTVYLFSIQYLYMILQTVSIYYQILIYMILKTVCVLLYNIRTYKILKTVSVYYTIFEDVWFQKQYQFIIQYSNIILKSVYLFIIQFS